MRMRRDDAAYGRRMMLALLLADTWDMHDNDAGAGWMIVMMLGMVVFWGW